jgi:hypothetical protein
MRVICLAQECWRMKEPIVPSPSKKIYHANPRFNAFLNDLRNLRVSLHRNTLEFGSPQLHREYRLKVFSRHSADYPSIFTLCDAIADVHIAVENLVLFDPYNNPFWLLDAMYHNLQQKVEQGQTIFELSTDLDRIGKRVGGNQLEFREQKILSSLGYRPSSLIVVSVDVSLLPHHDHYRGYKILSEGILNSRRILREYSITVILGGFSGPEKMTERRVNELIGNSKRPYLGALDVPYRPNHKGSEQSKELAYTASSKAQKAMIDHGVFPSVFTNVGGIFSTPEELKEFSPNNFLLSEVIDLIGWDFFSRHTTETPSPELGPLWDYFSNRESSLIERNQPLARIKRAGEVKQHMIELSRKFPLQFDEKDLHILGQFFWYNSLGEFENSYAGEFITQAKVIDHLEDGENPGIIFRLNKNETGIYLREKMSTIEWLQRNMAMPIGSAHDLEFSGGYGSRLYDDDWTWQVKPVESSKELVEFDYYCQDGFMGSSTDGTVLETLLESLETHLLHGSNDVTHLALYYAVALETFNADIAQSQIKSDKIFFELVATHNRLTSIQGRGALIDTLKPNKIHPCFHMKSPGFGLNICTNIAIMKKLIWDNKILLQPKFKNLLKPFTGRTGLLDLSKFSLGDKKDGLSPHPDELELTWYKNLKKHYVVLVIEAISAGLFDMPDDPLFFERNKMKSSKLVHSHSEDLSVLSSNFLQKPEYLNFESIEMHQRAMRYSISPYLLGKYNKRKLREIIGTYGDLGVPNPISPYDSSNDKPSTVLEAIESISHNNKNPGLKTHNRINGFLDMLWLNQHRRESYGNRFIGLDLLEEFSDLSSAGSEADCAKRMLFHSQKVIRLMDKPSSSSLSRTNKFSRQNLYSRLIYHFESYLNDETIDIDRMARPSKKSFLRILLHPIRLHTATDQKIDELPYGLVTQIMFSRINTLVRKLSSLITTYNTKKLNPTKGDMRTSPILRDAAFLRTVASLVAMEVCQLHMMSVHLPIESKSSKFLHIQTRNVIEHYDELQVQKMDLDAYTIDGEILKAEEIIWEEDSSILEHLKTNNLPTARDLIHQLSRLCLPLQNERDILSTTEREQIVKFVGSLLQFCDDESPTGQKYVEIARIFDQIYVDHMPTFMSPDVLPRRMFEYF